ncbi:unnamed protein product [Pedinophyceae sp. YPF-701]|nr:unnamed protein product [Pedinophyceae sp. YPF-701]
MDKITKVAPNGKQILKDVTLGMYLGAKIGILGSNGAGKSTLMRILAGRDTAFEGRLILNDGITVGFLEQEPELNDGETVAENIEAGVASVRKLLKDFEDVSAEMADPDADIDALMGRMDALQAKIDACNGWEVDRMVERAMDALRCPPGDAKVDTLSGGERRRVALARVVLQSPDILVLDEPTNHLDAESVAWLEKFLAQFRGTVVAVTHDRYFLDNVAGWILELDRGKGIPFEGNYSEWLEARGKRMAQEEKEQSLLSKQISAELEFVNSTRKGQQKKGKDRLRRYDDLLEQANAYVRAGKINGITIPVGPRLGNDVLEVKGVAKSFGDRLLYDELTATIPPGAVVGIVGANGAGKSTFFRMVMGEEKPDAGEIALGQTVVPMYAEQGRGSLLPDKTVADAVADGADEIELNGQKVAARAYCSWYNFKGADQQKKVGDLSGGERNRLQLARVLRENGNLLLLDEPTNDLDVDTLRALEDAILGFPGTTLVISHDRFFLDRVATHILAFEGNSDVVFYQGGWNDYWEDYKARTGAKDPERIKFRRLANA